MKKRVFCLICVVCLLITGMGLLCTSTVVLGNDERGSGESVRANDKT